MNHLNKKIKFNLNNKSKSYPLTLGLQEVVKMHLMGLGENIEREGLQDTPKRVVKSWNELYAGYNQNPEEILGTQFSTDKYDQMVICKDIEFYSTCEHHMLPFYGHCSIAYIPGEKVVGLSKLARLVDCFSRRLQIQEQLTDQIADALMEHLQPRGVGVLMEAKHFCMVARGVRKQNSTMKTCSIRGVFTKPEVKKEFLHLSNGESR